MNEQIDNHTHWGRQKVDRDEWVPAQATQEIEMLSQEEESKDPV